MLRVLMAAAVAASWLPTAGGALDDELGRSETRVFYEAFSLEEITGRTVEELRLPERLERLGYTRVHRRPEEPGEYFWGHTNFWIYRRAHRWAGRNRRSRLIGLAVERGSGRILGFVRPEARDDAEDWDERFRRFLRARSPRDPWLEPEVLAESLKEGRAHRVPVSLAKLPERVWRPVLAAEDARFFDHIGLDGRSIARAMLANAKAGGVVQGGSTITQQLVKNRELTPRRSLGRKVSEAIRALALEAEYDKEDILEVYLNHIYWGHVGGLAVHGIGAAARAYFDKAPERLSLAEAATLAGMIQGPNLHHPIRKTKNAKRRRDWVLARLNELEWFEHEEIEKAISEKVRTRPGRLDSPPARAFLAYLAALADDEASSRLDDGKGIVVESTLDPVLQLDAEDAVRSGLARLRRAYPRLRRRPLSAALVALDARTGRILAYVGGDPSSRRDSFDRVRSSRRQPGSAIKPFVLLEAFEDCGENRLALHPATRVADEPIAIEAPPTIWRPTNYDGRFHGVINLRDALVRSYNVPFVRVARHCGFPSIGSRLRRAGLEIPEPVPPSIALGSVEVSPLELAEAFTLFPGRGRRAEARAYTRIEKPSGTGIDRARRDTHRVAHASTSYLVHRLMLDAVERGTGKSAEIDGVSVAGKTGTSSALRDAWFAGYAGSVVTVVWVGLDDDDPLGLTGAAAAAPIFRTFMARAVPARSPLTVERPGSVRRLRVDPETGLALSKNSDRGRREFFRRGIRPRRDRWWRKDEPEPVLR